MRARSAANFTQDDLQKIAAICHEHNVKAYLTLNTILYNHDINLMKSIIDLAKKSGIDAVIAADHAAMAYARKVGLPVHISTQANISNIDTVEFYAAFADVMVLARELSLKQVAEITREIKRRDITGPSGKLVKIEIFGHGALCMAISGKCYMSLHSHYASANRGACIQNCRRSYVVTDKEEGIEFEVDNEFIMSAKDLCTIYFLDQIFEAGIDVLKIEGRGRAADYVYTTTQCYREALNACMQGTYNPEKVQDWMKRLETVFNRGFWDGYYLGKKMGEWHNENGSNATKRKIYVAKGFHYFDKSKVSQFILESQYLSIGDEIIITGPITGYIKDTVKELRVADKIVDRVNRGDNFTMPLNEKIRASDKLYKLVDA